MANCPPPGLSFKFDQEYVRIYDHGKEVLTLYIGEAMCMWTEETIQRELKEFARCSWLRMSKYAKAALDGTKTQAEVVDAS